MTAQADSVEDGSMKPTDARRAKHVSISLTVEVREDASQEEIADRLSEALRPMTDLVSNVSDVAVRTVPRTVASELAGGYETRLWEKATCRILDGVTERIYPVDHEIEEVAEELQRVAKRLTRG